MRRIYSPLALSNIKFGIYHIRRIRGGAKLHLRWASMDMWASKMDVYIVLRPGSFFWAAAFIEGNTTEFPPVSPGRFRFWR